MKTTLKMGLAISLAAGLIIPGLASAQDRDLRVWSWFRLYTSWT